MVSLASVRTTPIDYKGILVNRVFMFIWIVQKQVFVLVRIAGIRCTGEERRQQQSRASHVLSLHPCRFQKLHLACGSEHLILHSPLQPLISLCQAPAGPLQLPGGNVTITYTYVGGRAPMGQGFLLSYSQGGLDSSVCETIRTGSGSPSWTVVSSGPLGPAVGVPGQRGKSYSLQCFTVTLHGASLQTG